MEATQPFANLQPSEDAEKSEGHRYLHLHLKGGAFTFFDQQVAAIRKNTNIFNARKLKPLNERRNHFLPDLRRLAIKAYSYLVDEPNIAREE